MDGRAGVQPTDTNGSVVRDEALSTSSSGKADELVRFPLTIREVVRRGRKDRDELARLRAEVDELRVRAESAEHLLESAPKPAEAVAITPLRPGRNGRAHDEPAPAVSAPDEPAGVDPGVGAATNGHAANGHAANGNGATNGHSPTNGRIVASSTVSGWAAATILPRSKRS